MVIPGTPCQHSEHTRNRYAPHAVIPDEERRHSGRRPGIHLPILNNARASHPCVMDSVVPHGMTAEGTVNPELYANTPNSRHHTPSLRTRRHSGRRPGIHLPILNNARASHPCVMDSVVPHGMTAEGTVNPELYANTPNSHAVIPGADPESIFQS